MIRLLDFTRKSCTRMAGACPAYGSGIGTERSVTTVNQVPRQIVVKRSKEEEELRSRMFRDVSRCSVQ